MATLEDYMIELRLPTRRPIFKIEWMNRQEQVIDEISGDLIDGNLTIDLTNGVRRTCDITLVNSDGIYTPNPNGIVYLSRKFKLYTGLQLSDGTEYYNPQGIFNIGNPIISSRFSEKVIQIESYDNFALLNGTLGGALEDDYIINYGTDLTSAIKTILSDAGIIKAPVIYPNSYVLPIDFIKTAGETYGDLLIELANAFSWVIFFDVDGRPRFQPPTDETTTGETWDFLTSEVTYMGCDHNYDYLKVYNNIVVYGENIYGNKIKGTAQDTGIFSPTSIARIGLKTYVLTDSNIPDDSAAYDRADYELKQSIQLYESGDLKCMPVDIIKEGDIVTLEDASIDFNRDNYLVKQINFPLTFNGSQTMKVWKVRDISNGGGGI